MKLYNEVAVDEEIDKEFSISPLKNLILLIIDIIKNIYARIPVLY